MTTTQRLLPFLTISPVRDNTNCPILLIHSDSLPCPPVPKDLPPSEQTIIDIVNQSETLHTVVYLHAGLASTSGTSLASATSFIRGYHTHVPAQTRNKLGRILAVQVSALSRAHMYAASFALSGSEFARLEYCDLLEDVENALGVDSTLLGIRQVDFDYDEEMRAWVDRRRPDSDRPPQSLDPSKPLLAFEKVDFSTESQHTADRTVDNPAAALPPNELAEP